MYETYWNLEEKPFRNTTDPKYFFYAETHEEAYIRLLYSVTEAKGLMLLLGDGGCGKTFLCKSFFREMTGQGYQVALVENPDLSPMEFLQKVACEYGIEYQGKSKVELLKDIETLVIQNAEQGSTTILIVDEAQLIQNKKTLEEIRLLLNFETPERFPLSIILSARPDFRQTLRQVPSLKERVSLQHRIQHLNREETGEYICYRMDKAGCSREIFTANAVKEIHNFSGGIPRQINHLCDLVLLLGYGDSSIVVDVPLVKKSIEDLRGVGSSSRKY